jgi:hypothetical protein
MYNNVLGVDYWQIALQHILIYKTNDEIKFQVKIVKTKRISNPNLPP